MNQVTNRVPYGLLSQEEKADFNRGEKNKGAYAYYDNSQKTWLAADCDSSFLNYSVYRLVIEDDKWYTVAAAGIKDGRPFTTLGSQLEAYNLYRILRPAKPDEIPQDERTLEQRIQNKWFDKKVVMLSSENGMLRIVKTIEECEYDSPHVNAQSMKGFYKYVYEQDNDLIESLKTLKSWKRITIQPVAVLFERSEG